MKKHLLIFAALFIAASALFAQQKPGTFSITPKVGITSSNFSGKMPAGVAYSVVPQILIGESPSLQPITDANIAKVGVVAFNDSKNKFGYTAGAEAQYQFTNIFGLSLGAFYSQQGAKYNTKDYMMTLNDGVKIAIHDDLKIKINSIIVPILANAYVWKGLAVKAGIQPEFAITKKTCGEYSISYEGEYAFYSNDTDAAVKSFSLSVPVGVSYEKNNIIADLRYNIGLTDLRENGDGGTKNNFSSSSKNRTLLFTIGYKFGL